MVDQKPDCRCGYVTNYTKPFEPGRSCCFRKKPAESTYCKWHTREKDKSLSELIEEHSSSRIVDEAYLVGIDAQNGLSIRGWKLRGANFSSSNLSGADLSDTDLTAANFSNSNLRNTNLTGATLTGANLTRTNLRYANLTNATLLMIDAERAIFMETVLDQTKLKWANLQNSVFDNCDNGSPDFTDANLADSQLQGAEFDEGIFLRTNLSRANLFDASFVGSRLYGAVLTNARINENTDFGEYLEVEEYAEDSDNSGETNELGDQTETTEWSRTKWIYRQLEQLARNNSLHNKASDFYLQRKNIKKIECLENDNRLKAGVVKLSSLLSKHGESPIRIILVSASTILIFSVAYSLLGGIEQIQNPVVERHTIFTLPIPQLDTPAWISNSLRNIYFSSLTFIGMNFGDTTPSTPLIQLLAGAEALIGALLTAFFVFVLGRKTVR